MSIPDAAQDTPVGPFRISLLHVRDCPSLSRIRADVATAVRRATVAAIVEEVEGPYPSPTVLIDGVEIDGHALVPDPSCRIDLPGTDEITAAILAARARPLHPAAVRGGSR